MERGQSGEIHFLLKVGGTSLGRWGTTRVWYVLDCNKNTACPELARERPPAPASAELPALRRHGLLRRVSRPLLERVKMEALRATRLRPAVAQECVASPRA